MHVHVYTVDSEMFALHKSLDFLEHLIIANIYGRKNIYHLPINNVYCFKE